MRMALAAESLLHREWSNMLRFEQVGESDAWRVASSASAVEMVNDHRNLWSTSPESASSGPGAERMRSAIVVGNAFPVSFASSLSSRQ